MSCHLITDENETCYACDKFAEGLGSVSLNGEPSKPLCRDHFNILIDRVNHDVWGN